MQVLAVGLNHETAPLQVREKLAIGRWQLRQALVSLFDHVPQGIILSTCNRTEVYTVADKDYSQRTELEEFLSELGGIPLTELSPYLYAFHHEMAVSHLFRIASGLESMILGEFEVLGQVRDSLQDAESTGLVGLPLLNLFQQAVRVGRRARSETRISRNPVSVSSVALRLASKVFTDVSACRVLVISTGEAGKLTVKALVKHGISQVAVTSRSYEKALALASAHGGNAVPFHNLREALTETDIVISSSGAPHFILDSSLVAEAMRPRTSRPLVLIDIAVPRDIDPAVKDIENVHLRDIDDLRNVSGANHRQRAKEKEKVMEIIDAEVPKFMARWLSQHAVPTITALVSKADKIRRSQLNRTLSRIQASDEDRNAIDAMTQAIVKKILHAPIRHLKNGDPVNTNIHVVQELFDLDTEA